MPPRNFTTPGAHLQEPRPPAAPTHRPNLLNNTIPCQLRQGLRRWRANRSRLRTCRRAAPRPAAHANAYSRVRRRRRRGVWAARGRAASNHAQVHVRRRPPKRCRSQLTPKARFRTSTGYPLLKCPFLSLLSALPRQSTSYSLLCGGVREEIGLGQGRITDPGCPEFCGAHDSTDSSSLSSSLSVRWSRLSGSGEGTSRLL